MKNAAVISDVTKKYERTGFELKSLSLTVSRGEIVSVVGESGSGKSTLLHLIAGLERADSGSIEVGGAVVDDGKVFIRTEKRKVGLLFQEPLLFPHLDVAGNICFGLERISDKVAGEYLEIIGLSGFGHRKVGELSGGQRHRVALARTLAVAPDIILFDEPFSSLDVTVKRKLRDDIHSLLKRMGQSAVFVTHDIEDAFVLSDRIMVLREGRVCQSGTWEELIRHPADRYVSELLTGANMISGGTFGTEEGYDYAVPPAGIGIREGGSDTVLSCRYYKGDYFIKAVRDEKTVDILSDRAYEEGSKVTLNLKADGIRARFKK